MFQDMTGRYLQRIPQHTVPGMYNFLYFGSISNSFVLNFYIPLDSLRIANLHPSSLRTVCRPRR